MYPPLFGEELKLQSYPTSHGASLSPKWPREDRSNSVVSADVWGGTGSAIIPHPPTRRPHPRRDPRGTGGTWVYPPLCGEELEV